MFCTQCGQRITEDGRLCSHCGNPVGTTKAGAGQAVVQVAAPSPSAIKTLSGLGGWLRFVGYGLVLSPPLILLVIVLQLLGDDLTFRWPWARSAYGDPRLVSIGICELIVNVGYIVALVYLNILFFKKRVAFLRCLIVFLVVRLVLTLIDTVAVEKVLRTSAGDVSNLGWAFVGALIWIPYLLASQRVKATFVR